MNWPILFDPWESSLLCLALLHSLWQFALLAMITSVVDQVWRRLSVERSYALSVMAFVIGLAAVPATYSILHSTNPTGSWTRDGLATSRPNVQPTASSTAQSSSPAPKSRHSQLTRNDAGEVDSSVRDQTSARIHSDTWLRIAPWLAGLYVGGVVLMLVRLAIGIVRTERLRKLSQPIVDGQLDNSLRDCSCKWSLRVVPLLAQGEQIVVPRVIGLLKPTIVLPVSALTGLPASELDMILAHELAHLRRHDMWVNLLQRLAESALFFNPAMWYLSRRIATLREYCCDELTCRSTSTSEPESRMRYATALLKVVELAKPSIADYRSLTALAASGRSPSELRRRVARLLGEPLGEPVRLSRNSVLVLTAAVLLVAWGPAIWPTTAQTTENGTSKGEVGEAIVREAAKQFSFGGDIDVLAIGTHDENPQRWWDAAGNPIESAPFTWSKEGSVTSSDKVWRQIVFRVDRLPEDAGVQWHLEGARASGGGAVTIEGERNPRGYFTRHFGVADDQKTVDLRLGIATGPWKTAVTIGASGSQATGGTGNKSLVSTGGIEIPGGTVVVISHNYHDQDYRVVAVDKQGETFHSAFSGGAGAGEISQIRPTFPGVKPKEIDRFEFQVRDYEWVELKRLPLNPGGAHLQDESATASTATLDTSPEAAKKRADWLEKLLRLSSHNQTAFAVGPLMIFELRDIDAFEVVRQTWPKIQADEVKTGLLKTFEFARHPRVLDVLDLGARDQSQEVREYAYAYLQNYAMRDFKDAKHDYSAWRRQYAGQSVDQVLQANANWFVDSLRGTEPVGDQRWWMNFESKLNVDGGKSSYPNKAKYLREAGLVDVLEKWRDDPAASDEVRKYSTEILQQLRKASLPENESHQGAILRGDSMPKLVLSKGVDELFAGADLRESDLSGAMLVGGMKAFYEANFSGAKLVEANMVGQAAFQKAVFHKANLTDSVLTGLVADFQEASFDEANLRNVRMSGGPSSFQRASFKNSDLTGARLQGDGPSFQGATFDNAKLIGATIVCSSITAFQAVSLNNSDFSGADLSTIDAQALASCEFNAATPPKYSGETRFPKGFNPRRAGWNRVDD